MAVDSLKAQLVTRDFNRMLEEFASLDPKIEFAAIVRAVAIRVMAGALRRTKAADPEKIKARHAAAEWTTIDGRKIKLSWYLHDDEKYRRSVNHRVAVLNTKLGARGLSKQSWLYEAQKIGGTIDAPAYVTAANFQGRTHPENASVTELGGAAAFVLKVLNRSPIVQQAGGEYALIAAMAAETRYFFTLLSKGGFATAAKRAAKYPGVYVRPLSLAALPAGIN